MKSRDVTTSLTPPPTSDRSNSTGHSSQRRLVVGLLICSLFGAQTWAAASYYLGDYPWDERFSWRMFSSVRHLKCTYKVWRGQPLADQATHPCPDQSGATCSTPFASRQLAREHHMVWINLLKRGRLGVLDRLAAYECASPRSAGRFYVELSCPDPAQPQSSVLVQSPRVNLCERPRERGLDTGPRLGALPTHPESPLNSALLELERAVAYE